MDYYIWSMLCVKEFIQEAIETLQWIIAGCPQPVPIPVEVKNDKR